MRWLPLPTCRIPLRRIIASTTITALVLPMFGVPVYAADPFSMLDKRPVQTIRVTNDGTSNQNATPGAQEGGAAPDFNLSEKSGPELSPSDAAKGTDEAQFCKLDYDNAGKVPEDQEKFNKWKATLKRISEEHNRPAGDPGKEEIAKVLQAHRRTQFTIPEAAERQKAYLAALIRTAQELCPARQAAVAGINNLNTRLEAKRALDKNESCKLADARDFHTQAENALKILDEGFQKRSSELRKYHNEYGAYNVNAVMLEDKAEAGVPIAMHAKTKPRVANLESELANIWGTKEERSAVAAGTVSEKTVKGFFSLAIRNFDLQRLNINALRGDLGKSAAALKTAAEGCASMGSATSETGGKNGSTISGSSPEQGQPTGGVANANGTCSSGSNSMQSGGTELTPGNCKGGTAGTYSEVKGITPPPAPVKKEGEETPGGEDKTQKTGGVNPPPAPAPVEEESWFSKNKTPLIIGGVGVAAVAGALLWKKSEDDKAKDKASLMELEAMAAAQTQQQQNSSSSSSDGSASDDSTAGGSIGANQTPVGSSLMIEGSPSGSVGANTNLPPITVKVVNPEGIMTNDSATDISVSCASSTPAPCTLTGTVTVNTDMGKAVFSGLKFTGAHTNVTLLFSAPGFAAVKSGNFDVSGRQ